MQTLIDIHITRAIAEEYQVRDIFSSLWSSGTYKLPPDAARRVADDAEYQGDPIDGPDMHHATKRAYRILASRIREQEKQE